MARPKNFDPKVVTEKLIELSGGPDRFFSVLEEGLKHLNATWSQDTVSMGRVLRSHLVVEHFLTAYLDAANPRLGSLERARISFTQKVDLISETDTFAAMLVPGLRRLNEIRNRMVHNLSVDVTSADRASFLAMPIYRAMREQGAKGGETPSEKPLDVLEHFALFAAHAFQSSATGAAELWGRAFEETGVSKDT